MKKSSVILIWGGITGIVSVLFYQVLYATGMENSGLRWLNMLIVFLGIFVGTLKVRDKVNGGYLTYGQGYSSGFLMSLVSGLISTIAIIVDLQIHPDMVDKIAEKAQNDMINKGYTDQQIEISMHYAKMFMTPTALVIETIIGGIFFGAVLSLITAGISMKKKPLSEEINTQ